MKFISAIKISKEVNDLIEVNLDNLFCAGPEKFIDKTVLEASEDNNIICLHQYTHNERFLPILVGMWLVVFLWTCLKRKRCLGFWCCCCRFLCGQRGCLCRCVRKRRDASSRDHDYDRDRDRDSSDRKRRREERRRRREEDPERGERDYRSRRRHVSTENSEIIDVHVIEDAMHDD